MLIVTIFFNIFLHIHCSETLYVREERHLMHIITSVRSVRLEPTVLASLLDCVRGTVHRVNARLIRPHIR